MKQYKINIDLTNGDRVEAKSVGENQADALGRIIKQPQFVKFINESNSEIDKVEIIPIGEAAPISPEDYALQYDKENDRYIVADRKNLVMVTFAKGRYNDTAKVTDLNKNEITDALRMATILREIGEYVTQYHKELV